MNILAWEPLDWIAAVIIVAGGLYFVPTLAPLFGGM